MEQRKVTGQDAVIEALRDGSAQRLAQELRASGAAGAAARARQRVFSAAVPGGEWPRRRQR